MLLCTLAFGQGRTITGQIKDENGDPVQSASITETGTKNATKADENGNFSISIHQNGKLTVSSSGYVSQTISPAGEIQNFSLVRVVSELKEIVVTAVGVRREAKTLGYAVSTVKNEELTRGKDRSVLNSLQGKVAGVQITSTSGGVGSSTRIQFRGSTSLTGNNQALIVVDGIPINNSFLESGTPGVTGNLTNQGLNNQVDPGNRGNDINPEDVESITVLKGPAAAALYGSRAANGVLIITTKSGRGLKNKRSEIVLSSAFSLESILRLPEFQNEYGQGGQKERDSRENFSWGPKFDGVVRPWGQEVDGEQRVKPYAALPDNVKEFFNIGQTFTNNVSLSQNNDKNSYYVSFNNVDQKGIMPGTEYKRSSVRLTGNAELSNKFYSNATINYIRSTGDLSVQGQGESPYDQVLQTPRDIPLLELKDYKNNKFNTLSGYYGAYTVNPWYYLGEDSYKTVVDRILGNLEIGYKPTNWLDVLYRIGTDVSNDKRKQITSKRIIPDPDNQNHAREFPGTYQEASYNVRELTSDLIITGNHKFNDDLSIRVLVGHNINQRSSDYQVSTINSLVVPGLYNLSNSSDRPQTYNNTSLRRLYGVYADANLAFKNYLFLGLTARNDWSSTLRKGNNSFFYPSTNISFVFSDAFKMPEWISYGKLRASFAKVGKDAEPYLLQSVFESGTITDGYNNSKINFPINGIPGYTVGDLIGNPDLTPEFTTSYEGGAEVSFYNNRLGFDVTYYRNESRNQILTLPLAASTGFTKRVTNVGLVTNRGIEVLLRGQPIHTSNFTWEITGTFTKNKNRVEELYAGVTQVSLGGLNDAALIAKVGEPYGVFFGSGFLRDSLGRVVVDKATGYPVEEPSAQTHGTIQPDFLASVLNSFSYRGFTLTALFDGRKGGVFYSRTKSLQTFLGTDPKTLYNDREPFVIPNSVIQTADGKFEMNITKVQNAQNYWTDFVSRNSIEQLTDASFIKLREVSLIYRIPQNWIKKTPFSAIQVGLSGRNLFLWTPDENTYSDPETSSMGTGNLQGYEYGTIPSIRSYGANVRITL
jgi:TonB-linked SusC/RagA family outer membrane protein